MSETDEEVIWATSTTGDDFQCVHVDDWREAKKRIAELEASLSGIVNNWHEFAEMMIEYKTDYGLSERIDAASKLLREAKK